MAKSEEAAEASLEWKVGISSVVRGSSLDCPSCFCCCCCWISAFAERMVKRSDMARDGFMVVVRLLLTQFQVKMEWFALHRSMPFI